MQSVICIQLFSLSIWSAMNRTRRNCNVFHLNESEITASGVLRKHVPVLIVDRTIVPVAWPVSEHVFVLYRNRQSNFDDNHSTERRYLLSIMDRAAAIDVYLIDRAFNAYKYSAINFVIWPFHWLRNKWTLNSEHYSTGLKRNPEKFGNLNEMCN